MPIALIPQPPDERPNDSRVGRPWKGFLRIIETDTSSCIYSYDCTEEPIDGSATPEEARSRTLAEIERLKESPFGLARLAYAVIVQAVTRRSEAAVKAAEEIAGIEWQNPLVRQDLEALNLDGWIGVGDAGRMRDILQRIQSSIVV